MLSWQATQLFSPPRLRVTMSGHLLPVTPTARYLLTSAQHLPPMINMVPRGLTWLRLELSKVSTSLARSNGSFSCQVHLAVGHHRPLSYRL